jgi:hypothetical protein
VWSIEGTDVGLQQVRGVALRIDGDEHADELVAVRPEQALGLGEVGQRGRADIRTLRVAEEDDSDLALQAGQLEGLAVGIGQGELAGVFGAGDVERLEARRRGLLAAAQRGERGQGGGEQGQSTCRLVGRGESGHSQGLR